MALTRAQTSTVSARSVETSTGQHGRNGRKSRGRPRVELGPADVTYLRNELKLSWRKIARSLDTSTRKVRSVYAEVPALAFPAETSTTAVTAATPPVTTHRPKRNRRGRPLADLNAAEVVSLREAGMSWRQIGKKLSARVSTVRRSYARTQSTARCAEIRSTPWQKSGTGIPETAADDNLRPPEQTPANEQARESWLLSAGSVL